MPINRKDVRLKPLPLRVTPLQFDRLVALRSNDALAIQEHARRAIDMYLDAMEKKQARIEVEPAKPQMSPVAPTRIDPLPEMLTNSAKPAARKTRQLAYGVR